MSLFKGQRALKVHRHISKLNEVHVKIMSEFYVVYI